MKKVAIFKNMFFSVLFLSVTTLHSQERIAVVQETKVILLDAETGSIVDPLFITVDEGRARGILQVNNHIWITYQLANKIERYDLNGNYLGAITTGLSNIRGLSIVNNNEVWVTNWMTANGAPGNTIIRFDFGGNKLGHFSASPSDSPMDIIDNGEGEVYISYHSTSNIERRDYEGNFLGNIVEPGVVNYIQQIEIEMPGILLAGVFDNTSTNSPGIYRFDEFDGEIISYWDAGMVKGVAKLGNGNILYTTFLDGVLSLNPTTGVSTTIHGGVSQFFGRIKMDGCIAPPTPTGNAVQLLPIGSTLEDVVVEPVTVSWFATEEHALANTYRLPINTVLQDGKTYYAVNINDGCLSDPFAVAITIGNVGTIQLHDANLSYYPNPTSGKVMVSYSETITEISVSNLFGQKVKELRPGTAEVELDLSSLPRGVYFVNLKVREGEKTIKVVKE